MQILWLLGWRSVGRVKGSWGGLGSVGGSWSGLKQGWRVVQEKGGRMEWQGDGEAKGGRTDAACLSLPYPLSLYLFSLSTIDTHSEADTKTQSHSDNRQRTSLCFYSFCHRGRTGRVLLPLSSRQPMVSSTELFQQPITVQAASALPQSISARA